ncbi:MAG: UDP-N-acetylmuramoyl-tripeptide--D-alanyl-D-alanine ligase, partial [Flavobacteriaceae bacterium]|nr:UDP-N-acetylmuramoyl-tripeptide--D-alanyl-D-alanine ligase [Flavobacteriaceae bacterium]
MNIEKLYRLYSENFLVDTDTRKIRKGSLYFALKGENFNGNKFANEALNKGASFCIVDEEKYTTSEQVILVDNVLNTLQELSKHHRQVLQVPSIGLTGSNGKTTTKELINAVLRTKYVTSATIGNLNNHIGVPLTLLEMTPKTEIGIVEMGANHPKEIAFLCTLCQPDFGYITNFGKAHLEGFKTLEGVIEAKSELYQYLKQNNKVVFVNPKDMIQIEKTAGIKQVLIDIKNIELADCNPFVSLSYYSEIIQSNLIGDYNFSNLSAAIAIGNYFKVTKSDIKEALESYIPTNNRSEIVKTKHNTILLDAYNANPTSMKAALENFDSLDSAYKT